MFLHGQDSLLHSTIEPFSNLRTPERERLQSMENSVTPPHPTAFFIKQGRFSGINDSLLAQLKTRFQDHDWRVMDVREQWLAQAPGLRIRNVVAAAWTFRKTLLRRKASLRDVWLRSPLIFHAIRGFAQREVGRRKGAVQLSLATQSLFDASVPSVPHFIFTDHTHLANLYYPSFDSENLLPDAVIDLERQAYQNARCVFAMGSHVARSLKEHYGLAPERTVVCGGGANFHHLPALDNAHYENGAIGFVGIDWKRKGGEALLGSFRLVRQRLPHATLHLVGCPQGEEEQGVYWYGRLPQEEVARVLSKVSVFAFPTRIEPFGLAPIEAAALGLPVVASNVGAMPDIVQQEKTGLLVPPDHPEELAAALLRLLTQPETAHQMGQNGRQHVLSHFTWDRVGERVAEGISRSLSSAGCP